MTTRKHEYLLTTHDGRLRTPYGRAKSLADAIIFPTASAASDMAADDEFVTTRASVERRRATLHAAWLTGKDYS